jgi:hypothetical protein
MKKYLANAWSLVWKILEYAFLLAAAVTILVVVLLSSAYGDLKTAALAGLAGKAQLTAATSALKEQNWTTGLADANQADSQFATGLDALEQTRSNPAVKGLGVIRNQVDDLEYLLSTGDILSRSLQTALPIVKKLDDIRRGADGQDFNNLPPADKTHFLQLIYEAQPEIAGLKANLDLYALNLDP